MPGGLRICLALVVISALLAKPAGARQPPRAPAGRNHAAVDFVKRSPFTLRPRAPRRSSGRRLNMVSSARHALPMEDPLCLEPLRSRRTLHLLAGGVILWVRSNLASVVLDCGNSQHRQTPSRTLERRHEEPSRSTANSATLPCSIRHQSIPVRPWRA
jgi:hypothetical protein